MLYRAHAKWGSEWVSKRDCKLLQFLNGMPKCNRETDASCFQENFKNNYKNIIMTSSMWQSDRKYTYKSYGGLFANSAVYPREYNIHMRQTE